MGAVEESVSERRLPQKGNIFFALWLFIFFVAVDLIIIGYFGLSFVKQIILWTILCVIYACILYFLLEPKLLREIYRREFLEKEIVKEVPVIKEIEKPVIREVEKPIYITNPRKKLNIPKFDYVASSLTKVFHTRNCRISKSIKKKYKEFSNEKEFFKRKKYSGCKICITKEVKS